MRSLTLIFAYLSKDIWNRWLETPGAVVARVLVAVSLCLLFLFMNAGFSLTERAVEKKIQSFGINTVILRAVSQPKGKAKPAMDELLAPLGERGLYFPFSMLFLNAELSSGKKARIIIYEDHTLAALDRLFEDFEKLKGPVFLAAHGYPEAMIERVRIKEHVFDAEVVAPPGILRFVSLNKAVLFIPRSMGKGLSDYTVQESVLFLSDDSSGLAQIISAIEALLESEGFEQYELTSPLQWLGELGNIRETRLQAQALGGGFVGLLIVLIFGSIAVFEYRQNVFATALFKSFGLHSFHLIFRYLADGLVLLIASFFLALELAEIFHGFVFRFAGFDNEFLNLKFFNPYLASNNLILLLVLVLGVVVSILPVCLALRKPVGRVLG